MAQDSHMRERIFFVHSDPHGAAPVNGRFLAYMPDDDLLQWPIVASERGGGEISSCCRGPRLLPPTPTPTGIQTQGERRSRQQYQFYRKYVEEGSHLFKAKAANDMDAVRDRATRRRRHVLPEEEKEGFHRKVNILSSDREEEVGCRRNPHRDVDERASAATHQKSQVERAQVSEFHCFPLLSAVLLCATTLGADTCAAGMPSIALAVA